MYVFDDSGRLVNRDSGAEQIYSAALERLENLLRFLPDDTELELDYDSVQNAWKAMAYDSDRECAVEISDGNGTPIIAFRDVPYEVMISILDKSDVWYVG